MSSAWNWLGIFVWLFLIAYLLWMISNIHSRKKHLIKVAGGRKHGQTAELAERNTEITLIEIIFYVILGLGMGKTTFSHHITSSNSIVSAQRLPLNWTHTKRNLKKPNQKVHHYYVMVVRSRSRNFKQKYHFMIDGKKVVSRNNNSLIVSSGANLRHNINLSNRVQKTIDRKVTPKMLNGSKAWALRMVTAYQNRPTNGLGLHAGQKEFYYTILYVPKRSGIYLNQKKLKPKAKKMVPKG